MALNKNDIRVQLMAYLLNGSKGPILDSLRPGSSIDNIMQDFRTIIVWEALFATVKERDFKDMLVFDKDSEGYASKLAFAKYEMQFPEKELGFIIMTLAKKAGETDKFEMRQFKDADYPSYRSNGKAFNFKTNSVTKQHAESVIYDRIEGLWQTLWKNLQ